MRGRSRPASAWWVDVQSAVPCQDVRPPVAARSVPLDGTGPALVGPVICPTLGTRSPVSLVTPESFRGQPGELRLRRAPKPFPRSAGGSSIRVHGVKSAAGHHSRDGSAGSGSSPGPPNPATAESTDPAPTRSTPGGSALADSTPGWPADVSVLDVPPDAIDPWGPQRRISFAGPPEEAAPTGAESRRPSPAAGGAGLSPLPPPVAPGRSVAVRGASEPSAPTVGASVAAAEMVPPCGVARRSGVDSGSTANGASVDGSITGKARAEWLAVVGASGGGVSGSAVRVENSADEGGAV